jgi:hypothetical protein
LSKTISLSNYYKYGFYCLMFLLLPVLVLAQIVPEYKVNPDTFSLCRSSSISVESNGNYIITWNSRSESSDNKFDIYTNYYDGYGNLLDGPIKVSDNHTGTTFLASSIGASGKITICWWADHGIWIQQYVFDGMLYPINNNILVSDSTNDILASPPLIAQINNNNFIIVWKDYFNNAIFAQEIDANGLKTGDKIKIIEYQSIYYLSSPSVSSNGNDFFAITWGTDYQSNTWDIYLKSYKVDGTPIEQGSEIKVNTNLDSINNFDPNISMNANGDFVVCWVADEKDILMQCYNGNSQPIGNNMNITIGRESDHYFSPCATIDNNKVIIGWVEIQDYFAIYASKFVFDSTPHKLGDDFSICHRYGYDSMYPKIKLINDKIYSSWNSRELGGSQDIRAAVQDWNNPVNLDKIKMNTPSDLYLQQNYPNPFNPETTISYTLPQGKAQYPVQVKIYDTLGRLVITLLDEKQPSGYHSLKWHGKNSLGIAMPSGVYYCVVQAGEFKAIQKMLLVR